MHLSIGDKVKVLNEAIDGFVSKVVNDREVYVRTADGFDYLYPVSELIKVDEEADTVEYDIDESALSGSTWPSFDKDPAGVEGKPGVTYLKPYLERGMIRNKRGDAIVEIDLHLEALVTHSERLSNWEKIHVQVEHCKNCLEEAMRLKVTDLVFIHGKGEGRLKEEIRNIIGSYPNMEYFDADYHRYGTGATQVKILGLFT